MVIEERPWWRWDEQKAGMKLAQQGRGLLVIVSNRERGLVQRPSTMISRIHLHQSGVGLRRVDMRRHPSLGCRILCWILRRMDPEPRARHTAFTIAWRMSQRGNCPARSSHPRQRHGQKRKTVRKQGSMTPLSTCLPQAVCIRMHLSFFGSPDPAHLLPAAHTSRFLLHVQDPPRRQRMRMPVGGETWC